MLACRAAHRDHNPDRRRVLGARDGPSISGLVTTQGPKCCRIATSPHVGSQIRDGMGSTIRCLVRRDTYRDSVELMRVAADLEQLPGVTRAALLMATPANRGLLAEAGLLVGEAMAAGPNDLVIAVAAPDEAA